MANDQSTPQQPDLRAQITDYLSKLGQQLSQFNNQSQGASNSSMPETMYAPVGNSTIAMPFTPTPINAKDIQNFRANEPAASAGPYSATPQSELETAREYQNRVESPYMMFGANNGFAQRHPRMAGAIDNAFLAGDLVNQAHQKSLAAGGGLEGAGGAIGDIMAGVRGMGPARLAYRQQLAEVPVQYQQQEAALAEQRAKAGQAEMMGIRAGGQNEAQVEAARQRMAESAAIAAQQREQTQKLIQQGSMLKAMLDAQTKTGIQGQKDKTAVKVANIKADSAKQVASMLSGFHSGSPEDLNYKAQQGIATQAMWEKMPSKRQSDVIDALAYNAMRGIGPNGEKLKNPIPAAQAKDYATQLVHTYDHTIADLFGEYTKLPPETRQKINFSVFAKQNGVDLTRLQNVQKVGQQQPAPTTPQASGPKAGATQTYNGATYKFDGQQWVRQ